MDTSELKLLYVNHPSLQTLVEGLNHGKTGNFHIKGLSGSAKALFAATSFQKLPNTQLFIHTDKDDAAYFFDDMTKVIGDEKVFFLPSSYKRSVQYQQTDSTNLILRTKVMDKINSITDKKGKSSEAIVIVTYPEALVEKVVSHIKLKKVTLQLNTGEDISIDFLNQVLSEYHFERVDFVYAPGQYSIRGSIVDIFSFSADNPYRIDFFGDEVESIRAFDIESQLSKVKLNKVTIVPDVQDINPEIKENEIRESFLEFIPSDTLIWVNNAKYVGQRVNELYENTVFKPLPDEPEKKVPEKDKVLITGSKLIDDLKKFSLIEFGQEFLIKEGLDLQFNTSPQPAFNKNFELLASNLSENTLKGFQNIILSENEKQIERLKSIFEDINKEVHFSPMLFNLYEGFVDRDLRYCFYTDHQIFERYHKYRLAERFGRSDALTLQELTGLHPGDYVVHIDHGIGIFGGLQKIEVNGKMQEAVRLVYKDNDVLYVNINNLHRISKYSGKEGAEPKINKLGTPAWQKLKLKTKSKVKDIAKDLIALYAKRFSQKGFEFSPDTYLQHELEASFIYEDTPDQFQATQAVKENMESEHPMDMLVCGDVGFGKTEVAIRAAFKAVTDNKQVAVLVPTTILALQHYNTFSERLKNFPCTVDYISRLKKASDQKTTLNKLAEGKIDILIGTHRIVGKDVKFKDLGLLIIDEEQKFGVAVKEKLKKLRVNVDTLTLTATPIPRTLQFSLLGARDLSIINTPPPNRHPIVTELHTFNKDIIREGITYELSRKGQVFIIHNRVQNIYELEALINKICPGVKTVVAHGQMEGPKLEQIMLDFIRGDYDVLIATTIIEAGLDISNVNTIFVNEAQSYGLSDLHQLRGRVGRSNKKAFCYLLAPPINLLTPEAKRRLKAIEEFSELGSGFNIAMQDLDIRGSGNMLGAEQSGFIADIGFETYQKILNEAMQELRDTEFKEVFSQEEKEKKVLKKTAYISDCQIDTDLELLIPDSYVENVSERIRLYRELDNISNEEKLQEFAKQLNDRFGEIPQATKELFNVVRLRWLAVSLGFEKIILKNSKMILYFVSNQMSPYYQSKTFSDIIGFVQRQPGLFSLKEGKEKLTLNVEKISNLEEAIKLLEKIAGK